MLREVRLTPLCETTSREESLPFYPLSEMMRPLGMNPFTLWRSKQYLFFAYVNLLTYDIQFAYLRYRTESLDLFVVASLLRETDQFELGYSICARQYSELYPRPLALVPLSSKLPNLPRKGLFLQYMSLSTNSSTKERWSRISIDNRPRSENHSVTC